MSRIKVTKFNLVLLIIFALHPTSSQPKNTPPPVPLPGLSPPHESIGEINSASSFAIVAPDSVVQILQPPAIGTLHHFFYNVTPEGLVLKLVPFFDPSNLTTTAIPPSIVKEIHRDLRPPEVGEYWKPPPPPPQQQQSQVQYGPPAAYLPSQQEVPPPPLVGGYGHGGNDEEKGGGLQIIQQQAEDSLKKIAKNIQTTITKQSGSLNQTVQGLNRRIEKGSQGLRKFIKDVHEKKTMNFQELIQRISNESRSLLDRIRGGLTALGKGVQELTQTIFEKEEQLPVSPMEEYYGLSGIDNVVFVEEPPANDVPSLSGTEQPFNETNYEGGYSYG